MGGWVGCVCCPSVTFFEQRTPRDAVDDDVDDVGGGGGDDDFGALVKISYFVRETSTTSLSGGLEWRPTKERGAEA